MRELPTIWIKGKKYFVDFRLEEIRNVKTATSIPFRMLPQTKYSYTKKRLRFLRSMYGPNRYMQGIDDY